MPLRRIPAPRPDAARWRDNNPAVILALEIIASELNVTLEGIWSQRKSNGLPRARQITAYVLRYYELSFTEIGFALKRVHTACVQQLKRSKHSIKRDRKFAVTTARLIELASTYLSRYRNRAMSGRAKTTQYV